MLLQLLLQVAEEPVLGLQALAQGLAAEVPALAVLGLLQVVPVPPHILNGIFSFRDFISLLNFFRLKFLR